MCMLCTFAKTQISKAIKKGDHNYTKDRCKQNCHRAHAFRKYVIIAKKKDGSCEQH
ncbi:hypothetical protein GCM10025767_34370 [Thalassotalea piscium]